MIMVTGKQGPGGARVDMKLEVVVIPVSDVIRAKAFYAGLGWRQDAEFGSGEDYRIMQFTPPGSGCSVILGKNVTPAAPGSAQGLYLVVTDIEEARQDLIARGVAISEAFHHAGDRYITPATDTLVPTSRICLAAFARAAPIPSAGRIERSHRSTIRTATAGCCRR
jgi:predicted enzyme related to lactoylglutathione lyase